MKGQRLGNYEIVDKLGEGGMGEVWRARDTRLNRSVALKILPAEVASVAARRVRFEQEARSLAALNHANIVAVYDVGEANGRSFIVSELVDGESLRAVLSRGPLPVRKAIDFGVQMADAMSAAHSLGIVHRDLKPENVMITRSGRVKVLDFGLAKQARPQSGENTATIAVEHATDPGTVLGTAGYMSPEQVRGEPVDHRSDIFSFGSVLYEITTGKRAFQGASSVETMNAVLKEEPAELDVTGAALPAALAAIMRRCLEKRPEQRFQSAADLAFALRAIAGSSASGSQQAVAAPATGKRRWLAPVAAAVAAAVLLAAGFLARARFWERQPPHFQRITFRKGYVSGARFTPDGRNIVYAAAWDGGDARVYLAVPGNPESRDLDLPPASFLLGVSSRQDVAFLMGPYIKDGNGFTNGTLARTSITGGQMRPWLEGVLTADWSPDASSMAVERSIAGKYRLEYPIGNVVLEGLNWPLYAIRVSPDGERVAYVGQGPGSSLAMGVVDKAGKVSSLGVVSGPTATENRAALAWSPSGKEIWFRSFDVKDAGTLYAMDLNRKRRVLGRLPGRVTFYDVAADGRMLLSEDEQQVGILGVAPGETTEKDLSCLDEGYLRGISADGRTIVASESGEAGGPGGSIYLRKTDGSSAIRLGDGVAYALSPDGMWVSGYSVKSGVNRRFLLMPTGAGEEREVAIAALKNSAAVLGWLGDQKYIVSAGTPGKCFLWDAARGALSTVCQDNIVDAGLFVRPDGHGVMARTVDGRWMVYPIGGGAAQEVHGLSAHDIPVRWRSDNRSLFVITHHDVNKTLPVSVVDVVTGNRTEWKEIRPSRPVDEVFGLEITPDGRAWAYNYILLTTDLYIADHL